MERLRRIEEYKDLMKDKIAANKGKKSLGEKSYLDYATSTFGDKDQITYGLRLEES